MQKLAKMKWHFIHVRRRSPWYMYLWWQGLSTKTITIPSYDYRIRHIGSVNGQVVVSFRDWEHHRRVIFRLLKRDPWFLSKRIQRAYKAHERFTGVCRSIYQIQDFSKLSTAKLVQLLTRYRNAFFRCAAYSAMPLFVEDDLSSEIRRRMAKIWKNFEQDYHVVMTPEKDGMETQELESLLQLVLLYHKGNRQTFGRRLQKHLFDFAWLKNVGYFEEYFDHSYYLSRIRELTSTEAKKQLQHIHQERLRRKKELMRILRAYRKDQRLVALMQTINEAIYYRSFRSEQFYQSPKYLGELLKELASRLGVRPYHDIVYLTPPEVVVLLEEGTHADKELIARRKEANILISNGDWKYLLYEGAQARRLAALFHFREGDEKQIKGQVAYPGVIRGIAKVVKNPNDFAKVKEGDILVALATQPNYVPVLKKAAGFVTEEGGVLCHASVIAREMKKPCIIGTKIATTVLKDGDQIEVDAERGIVRKL